jgi:hypothetical protein
MATVERLEAAFNQLHAWIVQGGSKGIMENRWGREDWIAEIVAHSPEGPYDTIYGPDGFLIYHRPDVPSSIVGYMGRIDLRGRTSERDLIDAAALHIPE